MGKTKISWTHGEGFIGETWNPVTGCSKVSPGCAHCYAERMDKRIRAARGEEWRAWTPENATYNVRLHPERLEDPLHWKKPRMVFVNSMSDLFHESVPDEFIDKVLEVIRRTPQHTYQVLTKRPHRMDSFFHNVARRETVALANVWLGVSVENQKAADERIPLLLQTPAAVRFLSCEPLLGQVHLFEWLSPCGYYCDHSEEYLNAPQFEGLEGWDIWFGGHHPDRSKIDWVICGGESGPNFRPMNPDWARSIRDQCASAGIPFFFKQHSGYRPQSDTLLDGVEYHEFPEMEEPHVRN